MMKQNVCFDWLSSVVLVLCKRATWWRFSFILNVNDVSYQLLGYEEQFESRDSKYFIWRVLLHLNLMADFYDWRAHKVNGENNHGIHQCDHNLIICPLKNFNLKIGTQSNHWTWLTAKKQFRGEKNNINIVYHSNWFPSIYKNSSTIKNQHWHQYMQM